MQAESDNINPQLSAEYLNQWNGTTQRIVNIDITKIQPYTTPDGKEQPYKIKQDKIERLSISINDLGILQPIIVRKRIMIMKYLLDITGIMQPRCAALQLYLVRSKII